MSLTDRAIQVYERKGLMNLAGRSFRFVGESIIDRNDEHVKQEIIEDYSSNKKYLNIGGGDFLRQDWRVLDYYTDWYDYNSTFIDYDIDLETKSQWPIGTETFDLVYSSHTLEHLTDLTVEHTLRESYRILSPGGTIRINVPDFSIAARAYNQNSVEWFEQVWLENYTDDVYFAENKCPGYELEFYLLSFFATYLARVQHSETNFQRVRKDWKELETETFLDKYSNKIRDEWQAEYPGWHRNWFTADRLKQQLSSVGFTNTIETDCRQSQIPEMCTSEFDKRPHISVFVEAKKPM